MAQASGSATLVRLPASDGFPLAVHRFDPPEGTVRAAVVIVCATGVQARFYRDFASWLASQGVGTCTFDYRYAGLSFPPPFDASTFDDEERHKALLTSPQNVKLTSTWARMDLAAVIQYASHTWPDVPLTMFGNSLGGHLMALVPDEWPRITRFLNICGGNAFYGNAEDPPAARYVMDKIIRKELRAKHVFRSSYLGLGYDLPYGPGVEWIQWYLHPHFSARERVDIDAVRRLSLPYLYIGFTDDETISKLMMERHLGLFSHSDGLKQSLFINPGAQSPPWPPCKHVNSLMKSFPKAASPGAGTLPDEPGDNESTAPSLTREGTIWLVYLRWILHGEVDSSLGEHKVWTVVDERDIEKERKEHEKKVKREEANRGWFSKLRFKL